MTQRQSRKDNLSKNILPSSIITNMLLVVFCMGMLLMVAYISLYKANAENAKKNYAQSGINEKTNATSMGSPQDDLDTKNHTHSATGDIDTKIRIIKQQSEVQLTLRQQKNADSTFSPEHIIPSLFKTFNGDISEMRTRR